MGAHYLFQGLVGMFLSFYYHIFLSLYCDTWAMALALMFASPKPKP